MKGFEIVPAIAAIVFFMILESCKKVGPSFSSWIRNPAFMLSQSNDPAVSASQGFFLDNWKEKTFVAPAAVDAVKAPADGAVSVNVDVNKVITKVSKYIYGNNTNPFIGQFISDPDLIDNINALAPNILRAPGGSLSDLYFWNANGSTITAPDDAPDMLLNEKGTASRAAYWYGNNKTNWTLTLDNYYTVLKKTNSTGLITVNYGYARYGTGDHPVQTAAHLAAEWVRYDKGRTHYWEVGNECYGNWEAGYRINVKNNKNGQPEVITGALYGTHFKVFADSMRAAAAQAGNFNIKIGIVLTSSDDLINNGGVTNWNAGVLSAAGNSPDFYAVHNYYTPYQKNSTPGQILGTPGPATSSMMSWIATSVQNAGVAQKPVALDEWNIQATGSYQNVSNIAGLHSVMVLGEAIKNQISMASRWNLANRWANGDDQGMFNYGDEPGGNTKWNPRPAFYYMYFFQNYFGDRMVSSSVNGNTDIVSYGSSFTSGQAGVTLVNKGAAARNVNVKFKNFSAGGKYYFYVLNGDKNRGAFSRKVFVNSNGPSNGVSGGPANFAGISAYTASVSGGISVTVPAYGAVFLVADTQ